MKSLILPPRIIRHSRHRGLESRHPLYLLLFTQLIVILKTQHPLVYGFAPHASMIRSTRILPNLKVSQHPTRSILSTNSIWIRQKSRSSKSTHLHLFPEAIHSLSQNWIPHESFLHFPSLLTSATTTITTAADTVTNAPNAAETVSTIEESTLNTLGHDIFTFLIASVLIVPISQYFGFSPVLGFLIIGCTIGPYGLDLFSNTEADLQLGDFGILFLLFNEGLSLSPDRIKDLSTFSKLGLGQLIVSIGLFFGGTLVAGPTILKITEPIIPLDDSILRPILSSPAQAFCIAAAGALSSSAFVLPVLKSKQWESKPEGIAGLSILLLQDLAVAPLLVILPLIAGSGPSSSMEWGILIAKATVGFGGVLVVGSYALRYVFDVVAAARSTETFVAAALLVALGMGQTANYLGLSASTGAFAAGVLLAGNKYRPQIQADIKPFEGILLGVFFMTAGANLDPRVVLNEYPTLFTGIAAFLITKIAVVVAQGPSLGLTRGQAARVALTIAGGGEFSFVLFQLAQDLGVLPAALAKLLTASVIISMSLTPILGELGDQAGNWIEEQQRLQEEGEDGGNGVGKSLEKNEFTISQMDSLFDEIDKDGSNTIDLDELRVPLHKKGLPYSAIAEVFTSFDTNNDGTICREEWKVGLEKGLVTNALMQVKGKWDSDVQEDWETTFHPDSIVICGYGEMGKNIYRFLSSDNNAKKNNIVAFDLNPSRVTAGVLSSEPVIFGDGARYDIYKAAGVPKPQAVIITFQSQSRRLSATGRLRETLPPNTPIYVRAKNERQALELKEVGATDVVLEMTEVVFGFGSLLNKSFGSTTIEEMGEMRKTYLDATAITTEETENKDAIPDPIPGLKESVILELAEEVGYTRSELSQLYAIFSSLDLDEDGSVSISALRDVVLQKGVDGPKDGKALTNCMQTVDEDGDGCLTFEEFVRVSCLPSF